MSMLVATGVEATTVALAVPGVVVGGTPVGGQLRREPMVMPDQPRRRNQQNGQAEDRDEESMKTPHGEMIMSYRSRVKRARPRAGQPSGAETRSVAGEIAEIR